jgi:hypothetical protein
MMRMLMLALALTMIVGLGTAFFAGKTFSRSEAPQTLAASSEIDCKAEGGKLNALLDEKRTSPNIARATAEFERGLAECMWGRFAAADGHYRQAHKLLEG